MFYKFAVLMMLCTLAACTTQPVIRHVQKAPEVLIIYADGKMSFRDRYINQDDVVIYPDGYGGERAAIKMRVPAKSYFYRDSIRVERIISGDELTMDDFHGGLN